METKYIYAPMPRAHPDFVEGCEPTFRHQKVEDIQVEDVVEAGVTHVLFDWDHTLKANNDLGPPEEKIQKFAELSAHPAIERVDIATANTSPHISEYMNDEMRRFPDTQIDVEVFAPFAPGGVRMFSKYDENYWRKILFDTDNWDTPENVLMVGDSIEQDVCMPQQHGIQTALVDRFMKVPDIASEPGATEGDRAVLTAARLLREASDLFVHPTLIDESFGQQAIDMHIEGKIRF